MHCSSVYSELLHSSYIVKFTVHWVRGRRFFIYFFSGWGGGGKCGRKVNMILLGHLRYLRSYFRRSTLMSCALYA